MRDGPPPGWQRHAFVSDALRGNPLGDPHERPLWVWQPEDDTRRYPSVYVLQGLTGTVDAWFNVEPWTESFPERVSRLAPPAVVVLVDAFTALGGSQFVDSPAIGDYHTYLCDEVVPFVDAHHPTLAAREHRGVAGKSSGGYGAMITPLLRPDLFGGLATHAGDALFEHCFQRELAPAARALRELYGGSIDAFRAAFTAKVAAGAPLRTSPDDDVLLNLYAMAAAYSPGPDGAPVLPFDVETGEVVPGVWERWLAWDPVRRARTPAGRAALRDLRGVWIDAGRSDDFHLDLGAVAFHREVRAAGTPADAVRFELFEGRHFDIGWRYPLALTFLAERLA